MSEDGDVTLILFLVMGGVSAMVTAVGGYFGTRKEGCQAAFTPWTPCTDVCDTEPTRSRKYVIQSGASSCPYIDGYTETESCGPVTPCCEVEQDWEPEGTCSTIGLQKYTRRLKENIMGACEDFPKQSYVACCREEGDWAVDGTCGEHTAGKQRYKQTTVGCPVDKAYKYEDCAPCVGAWSNEIPASCPTGCGFGGATYNKTWVVSREKVGTGTCPHVNGDVESLDCDPSPTRCPCPGNWSAWGQCPTGCGQDSITVYRSWIPGQQDSGVLYEPCPTSESDTCDPTPSCCSRTEWTPSGQCENGQQKQIRTVSACTEDTETMRFLPCCEYTPWTPSGQCENDLQAQVREEIENTGPECAKEENIVLAQSLACCPYSAWTPSGQCVDDTQIQVRGVTTLTSGEPCAPQETNELERFMSCCGYSDWETSGTCTANDEGTDAALARVRSVIASTVERPCAPEETTAPLSGADPCCIEQGDWAIVGGCVDGQQKYEQTVVGSACATDVNSKFEECAPCEGSWSEAPCPTSCVLTEYENILKTWTTTTPAIGTGTCPTDADAPAAPTYSCDTSPCCNRTEWTPSGQCENGQQKQIRTVTEACVQDTETMRFLPCCEYSSWTPSGQCENELQAQVRQYVENTGSECAKEENIVLTQSLACCPYSVWTPSGQCTSDQQTQVREVTTLGPGTPCAAEEITELERFMRCCGYSDWDTSGTCTANEEGTDAALAKVRSVIASTPANPCAPEETTADLSGADPCCIEQGDWAIVGGCVDGLQKYQQTVVGSACAPDVDSRYDTCAPCEGSWSQETCPTECGLPRYDNIVKTWTTTKDAVGTGTCPTDADAPPAPTYSCLPTTPCVCEGSYDITCPSGCGYGGGDTRTFTQTGRVPGRVYDACPTNETCDATGSCPSGSPLGGIFGGIASGIGGAAAGFCATYPHLCGAGGGPTTGEDAQNLLDDVDVNCIGYWDKELEQCPSCGSELTETTATYKHFVKKQGNGRECEYHDGATSTKICPATSPCCEYTEWAPLVTGSSACVDGKINVSRTKTSQQCVEDPSADNSLNKYVPCQNCEGTWSTEFPSCPTACGSPATTVYKTWTTTTPTDANGYGGACPTDADRPFNNCPTNPCATDCEGGGWDNYAQGFPSCPTECGTPAFKYTRNWVGATQATNGGNECPSTEEKYCYPSRCPCPGYWDPAPCPNPQLESTCGQSAQIVQATWVPGPKDPNKLYNTCPTGNNPGGTKSVGCPAPIKCFACPPITTYFPLIHEMPDYHRWVANTRYTAICRDLKNEYYSTPQLTGPPSYK